MQQNLFSVRMRAARGGSHENGGTHISGAEKIVPEEKIPATLESLYFRAQKHELGRPDFINIAIERLAAQYIQEVTALPVYTVRCRDYLEGRKLAKKILTLTGIKIQIIKEGFHHLIHGGTGSGKNMRGAILMDYSTGCRAEPDQDRGIRASRMDYRPEAAQDLSVVLDKFGLNNDHVREALCLATKVANVPGIVAELCWSDDPGYTAGYVAAANLGYVRFPYLKEKGSRRGGRIFFIDPNLAKPEEIIKTLEQKPYIISKLGPVYGEMTFEEFKRSIVK